MRSIGGTSAVLADTGHSEAPDRSPPASRIPGSELALILHPNEQLPVGRIGVPIRRQEGRVLGEFEPEHLASHHGIDDASLLRRAPMERLFSVGANLDPESARP